MITAFLKWCVAGVGVLDDPRRKNRIDRLSPANPQSETLRQMGTIRVFAENRSQTETILRGRPQVAPTAIRERRECAEVRKGVSPRLARADDIRPYVTSPKTKVKPLKASLLKGANGGADMEAANSAKYHNKSEAVMQPRF
ncbi:MAG: hypothetical protein IJI27_06095 [Oscillospiraceae bacterium]|nr:hypothetical protein [Oscillospiraceae bacterium]